ncbi:MAG: hypothetical protein EPN25_10755 [Nitrospirae bacterium]|nr:MAG: hypothetical protein EPN25_10755 [Nitrospirota bacterium]
MITYTGKKITEGFLLALVCILIMNGTSRAAEYWLRAEVTTKTMPDASVITMWGFAQCTDGTYTTCGAATVPGPTLSVPPADSTLTVHLRNNLTGAYTEPVSIIIPGQKASSYVPVWTDGSPGNRTNLTQRVRSFTAETPPDNTTTVDYTWTGLKAGTYLYQSGTHPAVQVQMGLYGSMTRDAAAGQAYDSATTYNSEVVLLFSEIDPALHTAVAGGTYGTASYPSTYNYEPKYFLINGAPYSASSVPLTAGTVGSRTLLRILNAGLKPRVPVINGLYLSVIAEDGNKYLYPKEQYSVLLAAGKTMDALMVPATPGNYAIYDRRLALTNAAVSGGGMLAVLHVSLNGPASQIGVFQNAWYLDGSGNGSWDGTPPDSLLAFGVNILPGALPVTGGWAGPGTTRLGLFDSGTWYLDFNGNGVWDGTPSDRLYAFNVGTPGAVPVTGDWTGSGTTRIGVYDSGIWYLDLNGNGAWNGLPLDGTHTFGVGLPGAVPVTGDWTGSGTTRIGVYDSGTWYLDLNGNGAWDGTPGDGMYTFGVGLSGAVPVTGDWTGNGTTRVGVYDSGIWYLDINGNGAWDGTLTDRQYIFGVGLSGSVPLSGRW